MPRRSLLSAAAVLACAGAAHAQFSSGADVVYSDVSGQTSYTPVGGIIAYSFGTATCNMGNQNLLWTNNGTPGIVFNLYRLHDGRLEQVGQSWAKTACCAAAGTGCGLTCNNQGGSVLGAGCRDPYSAGWNGSQTRLMPRNQINAWTGQHGVIPSTSNTSISRRMQVATSDISAANFPGAQYFVEGVYVADDETNIVNKMNNASHRRVTFSGTSLSLAGTTQVAQPAILAWRANGGGVNVVDPAVQDKIVDVPGEGRFHVAAKASDNGNGTWRYTYAVFNLNSHVSGGSFSIPVPDGTAVSNIGFHDVDYHSGEPYDNTDWVVEAGSGAVTWRSPQTFDQNQNSNALRWGTMYTFWFDADASPSDGEATLGLFRPHTPSSVSISVGVPGGVVCHADWNHDQTVNSNDISFYLSSWLTDLEDGSLGSDFNNDGSLNSADISAFLSEWITEVTIGC